MKHRSGTARGKSKRFAKIAAAFVGAVAIGIGIFVYNVSSDPGGPLPVHLPTTPQSYLGVFAKGAPNSYAGVTAFERATATKPDIVMYYSGWYVPFPVRFADTAAQSGAVPLVQMDPDKISLAAIANGRYDGYLSSFAEAVRAYSHPVILSFGHEMNGSWYTWGYGNTSPSVFIAAWRHIVGLFRALGAKNVTWLWTVNIINDTTQGRIPNPKPWWPGAQYVNWVGIDGYYLKPSWQFAPLFGPTITAVQSITPDPILIAETGAATVSGQPAKIADAFAGVRAYGLLGLVWFDSVNTKHVTFTLSSPAAIAAFQSGAHAYVRPR